MALLMGLALAPLAEAARDGVGHGGGGDAYSLEFISYGHVIEEAIRRSGDLRRELPEVAPLAFMHATYTTAVSSEKSLRLPSGVEVDAINYPDAKKIVLSRSRWEFYDTFAPRQLALVFHEYLGILRIDDTNYHLSTKLKLWIEANGLPKPGEDEGRGDARECPNREESLWLYGTAGIGCDSRALFSEAQSFRVYHDFIFYRGEDSEKETARYMEALVPLVNEAAEVFLRGRREASSAEVQAWQRLVASVVQSESLWSHFRLGKDGRLKISRVDAGHGWGLLAIDDRNHRPEQLVDPLRSLGYGMDILFTFWERAATAPCVGASDDWRARSRSAYSAFNGGPAKLCRWNSAGPYQKFDQTFAANFDARPWLSLVKNPEKKSGMDVACLLRSGAAGCLDKP